MGNKEKNFASAVIYLHNAEERAERFVTAVLRVMEENFEHSEVICVNDSSTDGSVSAVRRAAEKAVSTGVTVINMSYFHGLETAMNAGMDLAIGDFVFEFDNTVLDFDESMIMEVYRHSLKGYDIVSASPDRKAPLTSRLFYRTFEQFAERSGKMSTESFRVLSRRVINRISSMNKTIPYRKAVYASCGLKTDNLRYTPTTLKNAPRDKAERQYRGALAVDSLILFTKFGFRFSMGMTIVMMLVSVFMIVYSLVCYFSIHPVEGWTTTILFLSAAFFGLFGILTVIVKYLQLLVDLVFKRKQYTFESIEKLTK